MNLTGKTSHGLFSRVLALVCVLCLLAGAGLAETIVIIDDLVYGEDAFNLHMDDVPNTFTFEGEKYTFDGHYIDVKAYRLYGGNTRALHEYSVPHKEYSVEDDGSQKHLVTITLNPRRKTTLRIAEGNRVSGEFTVSEPIVLTDPWVDEVYLPRDAAGHPVLVDRIYIYSYQEGGETKRYATGLYIDYENYTARHAQDDIVDQLMDEIANTIEESRLIDVPVFYMSVSGELLAEGKVSALKGETKTVEANMKLIPGYDVVGETKADVTFGENGPEPAQVFFMCTTAAPTPTPEPAFVMVPVYYMTTTGEVLVKQEVKCFEGTETTVEVDLSLVPGLVLINNASAVITVSNQVAAPSQVFFMCGPEPTATPTLVPTATPTLAPTATPTLVPTATPTLAPTATPTLVPTAVSTLVPTVTPTLAPTAEPVEEPVDMGDILFVPEECDDATLFGLNDEIKTELEKRIAVMQATKPAEDFLYASNGTEVRINKYIGKAGDVIFPDEINGQPVTLIANGAFSQEKLFKAIRLPRYLREIGSEAFNYNYGLTGDLVLPETLEKVSSKAFIDANFTGLYIQSSCDISSVQTFAWMDKCQFVYIKDGCQVKIGATTFTDAETMTAAVIPASVTEIADKAFDGCNRVVIYTPAGSYAEEYAKRNFISVNTAEYEQMAALYAEKLAALNAAADLYSYETPAAQEVTAEAAEDDLLEMSAFTLDELSMISDMIALELEKRGYNAFESTPASDFLYASNGAEVRINAYAGTGGDVVFPSEIDGQPVTMIAKDAFSHQKLFKAIRLPDKLREIGSSAFNYNYGLTGELILPRTLEKVSSKAFIDANFTGLYIQSDCDISGVQTFAWMDKCRFVYIKDGCQVKIGSTTFSDSETMTAAVIPASVTEIADRAFDGSNMLVIYTTPGSFAEEYAQRNFICVDTDNYELMNAYYSHLLNMRTMCDAALK